MVYALTKQIFRKAVPNRVQRAIWDHEHQFPFSVVAQLKHKLEKSAEHDAIYDARYFASIDSGAARAADHIVPDLVRTWQPGSVVDVGCGSGAMLEKFRELGVDSIGLEHATAAIALCHERGLDVRPFDLESDTPPPVDGRQFDLCVSAEVAEHLPEAWADRYVSLLCALSDRIVMTAATPGQGGTDHVNEQPHAYWVAKFAAKGFVLVEPETERFREAWSQPGTGVAGCYFRNVMVFKK